MTKYSATKLHLEEDGCIDKGLQDPPRPGNVCVSWRLLCRQKRSKGALRGDIDQGDWKEGTGKTLRTKNLKWIEGPVKEQCARDKAQTPPWDT